MFRRHLLKAAGSGVAGLAVGTGSSTARGSQESKASITFNDQSSDGTSLIVAKVHAEVPALLSVFDVQGDSRTNGPPIEIQEGETATDVTVPLDPPLEKSQQLEAKIHENNGGEIAKDTAFIQVGDDEVIAQGFEATLIDADPSSGFNYPYYLYAPPVSSSTGSDPRPIMVQPVNTGKPSDDFSIHREAAHRRITERWTRRVSDELSVPLLVPVFPRPESEPVDSRHDPHSLDAFTMHLSEGSLKRVDLQLKRMIEDARQRLRSDGYPVANELILNGFSASGTFVNRWAAMHPENVLSLSAGGTNGMVILPKEQAKGYTLNYQLGIADFESLIGKSFNLNAFADIEQFLYLGELDGSDWLPQRHENNVYKDQSLKAYNIFGPDLQRDRFPYCQTVYEEAGVSAYFRIYQRVGHNPMPAVEDIIEFHRRAMAGEDLSTFNEDLGSGGGAGAPSRATREESTPGGGSSPTTPEKGSSPTSSNGQPGFGPLAAIIGAGGAIGYRLYSDGPDNP